MAKPSSGVFDAYLKACTLSPYRRMMVCVDHSIMSAKVLERALYLAKVFCIKTYIVHVQPTKPPYATTQPFAMEDTYHQYLHELSRDLLGAVKKRAELAGTEFEVILLEGDPAEKILDFIRDYEIDLVVVGSKEKVGSAKNLGSVSARIATEAKCSVLIER